MNYADEIRRQAETAPRAALPAVAAALWRAFSEGEVSEAAAEALSGLIESRRNVSADHRTTGRVAAAEQSRVGSARRAAGSRPRTDASMERRRRWAASGRLPPGLAARFTLAEQAVLSLVAAETVRRKDCRLSIENMAAVTGVSRSTVKSAIRVARQLGLLTVEERQVTGWRNDTNVIRVVGREWLAWLRLARRTLPVGGGVKSSTTTLTQVQNLGKTGTAAPSQGRLAEANPTGRTTTRTAGA